MKNKFLLASVTFLSVVSLSACTSPKKASSKSSVASSSANVVRETTNSSSNVEKKIPDSDKGNVKTKRIGSSDYGYVNIPSDWKKNDSIQVGDNIQYTDKNAFNIIVLNAATREKAKCP